MLHYAHDFGRELQEQLARQNYIKQTSQWQKLKDTRSFQDKGDRSADTRIKREVTKGGTEKTEKRKRDNSKIKTKLLER